MGGYSRAPYFFEGRIVEDYWESPMLVNLGNDHEFISG